MSNTIHVPRKEVERLIKLLRYTAHPMPSPHAEHWAALLKAAPASTGAEPVAWMYEGRTTANSAVLDDWLRSGFQVTPLYTHPPAQDDSGALALLSDIRFACGDNGRRMQPDLVEYIRELAQDAALLDSDCIMTHERDEFGQEYKCERRGIDLRAAIAEAIAQRGGGGRMTDYVRTITSIAQTKARFSAIRRSG